jgi:hypothetical protein
VSKSGGVTDVAVAVAVTVSKDGNGENGRTDEDAGVSSIPSAGAIKGCCIWVCVGGGLCNSEGEMVMGGGSAWPAWSDRGANEKMVGTEGSVGSVRFVVDDNKAAAACWAFDSLVARLAGGNCANVCRLGFGFVNGVPHEQHTGSFRFFLAPGVGPSLSAASFSFSS